MLEIKQIFEKEKRICVELLVTLEITVRLRY